MRVKVNRCSDPARALLSTNLSSPPSVISAHSVVQNGNAPGVFHTGRVLNTPCHYDFVGGRRSRACREMLVLVIRRPSGRSFV
jgi:hypothetical protein